ncbi:hypothetical protein V8D89_004211 [Ganoderma adspersum]
MAVNSIEVADANFQKYSGCPNGLVKKAEEKYNAVSENASDLRGITSPLLLPALQDIIDMEPVKEISSKISAIVDGIPALLSILDTVAEIHPFIKFAVGAFRVAVELDLKHRENDKKVSVLFAAMRDMMAVLAQLKGISGHKRAGDGDVTIAERMQRLIEEAAEDIKNCVNSCNAYAKIFIVSKVLLSGSWSNDFKKYMERFLTCRDDFVLALSIYTSQAMNAANDKLDLTNGKLNTANSRLDTTQTSIVIMSEKVDRILSYFKACMSPEEHKLTDFVKDHGGPEKVMSNNTVLRELFDRHTNTGNSPLGCGGADGVVDQFESLQVELRQSVESTITDNMVQFQKDFDIWLSWLIEVVHSVACNEGNCIIAEVTHGPHNKIDDPGIYKIWKQQHWRGTVKGREFVVELRNHFRDLLLSGKDAWALEYIDVNRVQAIIEAFSDEAACSGYITVAEVNAFTSFSRLYNWSLVHWLAYWAVGHQMAIGHYVEEIDVLLAKMFALKHDVLPVNQNRVD